MDARLRFENEMTAINSWTQEMWTRALRTSR